MEYLEGADLVGGLASSGPLSVDDAVDYVLQACEAMAEAHAVGIVHRDLKPSNLFLTKRSDGTPLVKVLDFGISKVNVPDTSDAGAHAHDDHHGLAVLHVARADALVARTSTSAPTSGRSASSCTSFWREPSRSTAKRLPQLVAAILAEPPQSLRAHRPDVSPELDAVVMHCLEKDRDRRFQSVGAMAQALVPFASRRSRFTAERIIRMSGLDMPGSGSAHGVPGGTTFPASPSDLARATASGASTSPTGARTNTSWTDTNRGAPQSRTAAFVLGGLAVVGLLGWRCVPRATRWRERIERARGAVCAGGRKCRP